MFIRQKSKKGQREKDVGKKSMKTMWERRFVGPVAIAFLFPHLRTPTTNFLESTCSNLFHFIR